MKDTTTFIAGAGLGAGLMYVLDPERGRRRRALARDKVVHMLSKTDDAIGTTGRDMANRARGLLAEARARLGPEGETPASALVQRVRETLGHYSSHPGSIEVTAADGRVTLAGVTLASEVDALLRAVERVRGVRAVENRLEVHERADDVPGLQGGIERAGEPSELMQSNWSPTARVLVGAAGAGLLVAAGARRDLLSGLFGVAGFGMLARAASNMEMRRLIGAGGGRRAVDVHKTISVNAPVETVFDFWRTYESFPRFMSNVRAVRDLGGGRSHWTVAGPAGTSIEWDAEITRETPNELLAWKSVPGSAVQHAGLVKFEGNPDGTTRLDIRLFYNPPAGALGHAVAALFAADPKSQLDADLLRMKTLLETGRPPHDAAAREPAGEGYVH